MSKILLSKILIACAAATLCAGATAVKAAPTELLGVWQVVEVGESHNFDPNVAVGVRENAPLTPEYRAIYDRDFAVNPPMITINNCALPRNGMPRVMRSPVPLELVPTPEVIYIIDEQRREVRRIYMDGRMHPAKLALTFEGHSIGHWEGDVLMVDTVGIRAGLFDEYGLPHSDQIHVVEQIRRVDKDTLEDRFTITDSKAFTGPWRVTRQYKLKSGWEVSERPCDPNGQSQEHR